MNFKYSLLVLFILQGFNVAAQDVSSIDALYEKSFDNADPGGAAIIMKGDKIVFEKYFGVADVKTKEAIDKHTILNTGSISKTFVAYGILKLEEEGKLSTDDTIDKYFNDFDNPEIAKRVTIQHLLTHTSGLPDIRKVRSNPDFFLRAKDQENWDPIKKTETFNFAPGERFEYSNPAFNALALIIEKVSGKKWQEYIHQEIFVPAEMKESKITDGLQPSEGVAHAYVRESGSWNESDYGEVPTFAAAGNGGVWCSIGDLIKYEKAIRASKFVALHTVKKSRTIFSPHNWSDTKRKPMLGHSWFIQDKEDPSNSHGVTKIYHTGSQGGFRAFHISIPEKDILYIALFNRPVNNFGELMNEVLKIVKASNWFD